MDALSKMIGDNFKDSISSFDSETFTWKLNKNDQKGLTLNTIRLVELFANVAVDSSNKVSKQALEKVEKAISTILAHASTTSPDDTDEN